MVSEYLMEIILHPSTRRYKFQYNGEINFKYDATPARARLRLSLVLRVLLFGCFTSVLNPTWWRIFFYVSYVARQIILSPLICNFSQIILPFVTWEFIYDGMYQIIRQFNWPFFGGCAKVRYELRRHPSSFLFELTNAFG